MCWNAHRTLGESCQVARVTRVSVGRRKPDHPVGDRCRGRVHQRFCALHAVTLPEGHDYASPHADAGEPLRRPASTSATNWQDAPFNRWAFWHVRELLPTHPVSRGDGPVRALPDHTSDHDVLSVEVTRVDGSRATVADVLDDTFTDAYAVLQDGALVAEAYQPTGGPHRTHAVLSITKSVVGVRRRDPGRPRAARPVQGRRGLRPGAGRERVRRRDRPGPARHAQWCAVPRGVHQPRRRGTPARPVDRRRAGALRRAGDGGSIRSSRRCARRLRTGAGSSTAPPRPTCSAGSASGLAAHGWPT